MDLGSEHPNAWPGLPSLFLEAVLHQLTLSEP